MITLKVIEIAELASIAGIDFDVTSLEVAGPDTEITVFKNEGKSYAFFTEYPEEGNIELGDPRNDG